MTTEQSRRVKELLHQARALDRAERSAFLEKSCGGDPVLRAEVERLLGQETRNHIGLRRAVDDVLGAEPTRTHSEQPTVDLTSPTGPVAPAQVLVGQQISHYLVEGRLGAGGMGEVFLARDRALGRMAALKVLRPGFTRSVRDRLLREAWASARLEHPGIATFYEAGQAEGVDFIAMEYVRGETLRDRLRAGPLAPAQAFGLVVGVLEALVHAHFSGIMHRDIKPENIMITPDGSAKLLDMGLAKGLLMETDKEFGQAAGTSATGEPSTPHEAQSQLFFQGHPPQSDEPWRLEGLGGLTQEGAVIGTLGYMPPEQLRGERVGVRADVFAVGAVLYEVIKGRPAFLGPSPDELLASMLHRDPDPIEGPDIPPELNSVLARALAPDPSDRYPSATVFLKELRRIGGQNVRTVRSVRLAPLDFNNVSDDESNAWIASALPESLAAGLARVPGFSVLPRQKVLMAAAPAGSSEEASSPVAIGLRLGCSMVLSGSYQPAESQWSVTARMTDVATGEVVFEHTLCGSLEQIFDLPDRFAGAVAASLDLELPQSVNLKPDVEVCECHARARHLLVGAGRGSFEQARDLLDRAVSIDPGYAPALATLAQLHAMQHNFSTDPRMLDTAAEYARRAIEADPLLGEAHLWNGYTFMVSEGKRLEAQREFRKAIELDPSNFLAFYFAGAGLLFARSRSEASKLLETLGGPPGTKDPHLWRRREAARLLQRALELNPMFCWAWLALGCSHLDVGNFGEARWCLTRAVELEPRAVPPTAGVAGYLGECLRRCGEPAAARSQFLTGLRALEETDHIYRDTWRGLFLCGLGRTALEQGDLDAARVAFTQASLHLRGRRGARCGGHVLVQALAGLTRCGEGPQPFEEAMHLFEQRERFNFSQVWTCDEDVDLLELSRAASTLDRVQLARELLERARDLGSAEALIESGTSFQPACRN